jgi:WD40 repeat protein
MKFLGNFEAPNLIQQIKFSPDGLLIAGFDEQNRIYLWNALNGEMIDTFDFIDKVVDLCVDEVYLAVLTGYEEGTISLIELSGHKISAKLYHTEVLTLESVPGTQLFVCGRPIDRKLPYIGDGYIELYDHALRRVFNLHTMGYPTEMMLSQDGRTIVSRSMTVWQRTNANISIRFTQSELVSESAFDGCEGACVAISSFGNVIALGCWGCKEGQIFVVNTENGRLIGIFGNDYYQGTASVAVSKTGRYLLGLGYGKKNVDIWNLSTLEYVKKLEISGIKFLRFSPDGFLLAVGTEKGIHIYQFDEDNVY